MTTHLGGNPHTTSRKYRTDDQANGFTMNPRNPRGPKPDDKHAETYAEVDEKYYYLLSLYGRQDRKPQDRNP